MEAYIFRATCTNVVDGDTIDCELDLGFNLKATHRLRFYGVNTPEMHDKDSVIRTNAKLAKEFVKEMVLDKEIMVQTYKSDVFGRYLAKVFIPVEGADGVYNCLNDLLVREGYAEEYMADTDLLR